MKVKIFATLRQLVGAKEIEVRLEGGDTVETVIARLVADYPVLGEHILDDEGNLEAYINVFVNEDDLIEIEAGFRRADFCSIATGDKSIELKVVGRFVSGQNFYGTDIIRIINNNFRYLAGLTLHWLEDGCRRPDWCGGFDVNQDCVVNFVDFAMFDGCCIEIVTQ